MHKLPSRQPDLLLLLRQTIHLKRAAWQGCGNELTTRWKSRFMICQVDHGSNCYLADIRTATQAE